MILTHFATFALTLWASVHGRTTKYTADGDSELQFQAEQVAATAAVVGGGDNDRSANLKYVMAIQTSSIWADVKLRSLTVSTADARTAEIVNAAPDSLSDDDLATLRRVCHDGLKCVAVDQLLVLRSTTVAAAAAGTPTGADNVAHMRRAITKITRVLTQYTDEYHGESTYQYVEVTESDDPSAVSQSVTVILKDNGELCGLAPQHEKQAVKSAKTNDAGSKAADSKTADSKAAGTQEPALINKGLLNYGTINNININNGTINKAEINSKTPPADIVFSPDQTLPPLTSTQQRDDKNAGSAVDSATKSVKSAPKPADGAKNIKTVKPKKAKKPVAGHAHDPLFTKARDSKPADDKNNYAGDHYHKSNGNDKNNSKSNDKNNKNNINNNSDDKNNDNSNDKNNNAADHDQNNNVTLTNGTGDGGKDDAGNDDGDDSTGDRVMQNGRSEDGGVADGSSENDLEVDIVSAGSGNTHEVGKGYVEDGTLNNGRLSMRDENTGVRNKGIVNRTSAKDGIINVGTLNNGPTNYGTANRSTNRGTVTRMDSKSVEQYAADVDAKYSSILQEFANY